MGDSLHQQGLRAGAVLGGLFGVVTLLVAAGWTQSLDDGWNKAMASAETAWLVAIAEWFQVVGTVPIVSTIVVLIGIGFILAREWGLAVGWIVIVGASQIVTTVTKLVVGRPRPVDALVHESSAAYPSGHATVSGAAMAIGLAVLLGFLWPHRHGLFLWVGVVYAVIMAWSRTYLRVHWLSDVVGGLMLGTAMVLVVIAFLWRVSEEDA